MFSVASHCDYLETIEFSPVVEVHDLLVEVVRTEKYGTDMTNASTNPELQALLSKIPEMDIREIDDLEAGLKEALKQIDKARVQKEKDHRNAAIAEAEAAVDKFGYSLKELFDDAPRAKRTYKKASTPGVAKYRNPESPEQTWTGKGRVPNWIHEQEAKGLSRESFLIDKS